MRLPEFPAAASLASVLILIPLPTQIRVRNVALLVLIVGTFFINIVSVVNTLVWAGNARDVAPVWCDIGESSPPPENASFDHGILIGFHSHHLLVFLPSFRPEHWTVHRQTSGMDVFTSCQQLDETKPYVL